LWGRGGTLADGLELFALFRREHEAVLLEVPHNLVDHCQTTHKGVSRACCPPMEYWRVSRGGTAPLDGGQGLLRHGVVAVFNECVEYVLPAMARAAVRKTRRGLEGGRGTCGGVPHGALDGELGDGLVGSAGGLAYLRVVGHEGRKHTALRHCRAVRVQVRQSLWPDQSECFLPVRRRDLCQRGVYLHCVLEVALAGGHTRHSALCLAYASVSALPHIIIFIFIPFISNNYTIIIQ
jgi:hypothetical protein